MAAYDPLLGKTYAEIGTEARSMHKCQGMAQLLALPGPAQSVYQLVDSTLPGQMQKDEASLFDGVDSTISGLAEFAGSQPPADLVKGLSAIASAVQEAQKQFTTDRTRARSRRCSPAFTPCARCGDRSATSCPMRTGATTSTRG